MVLSYPLQCLVYTWWVLRYPCKPRGGLFPNFCMRVCNFGISKKKCKKCMIQWTCKKFYVWNGQNIHFFNRGETSIFSKTGPFCKAHSRRTIPVEWQICEFPRCMPVHLLPSPLTSCKPCLLQALYACPGCRWLITTSSIKYCHVQCQIAVCLTGSVMFLLIR